MAMQMASQIAWDMFIQAEQMIMGQLNELVSRGAIKIERTKPILVFDHASDSVKINDCVRFVLKDQEYIENLERQNEALKKSLNEIKTAVSLTFQEKK